MIDSQAVKNTCNASIESKGFCRYKLTNGIKRHLAVDSLGFPFLTIRRTCLDPKNAPDGLGRFLIPRRTFLTIKCTCLDPKMHLAGGIAAGMVASGGIAYGHGRFFTHCTKASVSDDQGLIEMLSSNIAYFKSKPVNIAKVTILLDNGYHKDLIQSPNAISPAQNQTCQPRFSLLLRV